ncbi:MAG: peptidase prepilin type [Marmoricola sp.]|nr:peptidase prepilin type [Marmoricola sp.]
MTWTDHGHPLGALVALVLGAVLGLLVPRLIAALPEPDAEPEPEQVPAAADDGRATLPPPPPKESYAAMAALPGLAWRCAVASGLVAAVLGASVGWTGALVFLVPLAPIGVALALVDWRTTLLPTRIVAPSYGLVVAGIVIAGLIDSDHRSVVRAVAGWAILGGLFGLFWLVFPRGMGYGDVRLSGVLGFALGYLGWSTFIIGVYAVFIIGGLGGALLSLLRIVDRKRFPFGPFMLIGSVVGVALGPAIAGHLGY